MLDTRSRGTSQLAFSWITTTTCSIFDDVEDSVAPLLVWLHAATATASRTNAAARGEGDGRRRLVCASRAPIAASAPAVTRSVMRRRAPFGRRSGARCARHSLPQVTCRRRHPGADGDVDRVPVVAVALDEDVRRAAVRFGHMMWCPVQRRRSEPRASWTSVPTTSRPNTRPNRASGVEVDRPGLDPGDCENRCAHRSAHPPVTGACPPVLPRDHPPLVTRCVWTATAVPRTAGEVGAIRGNRADPRSRSQGWNPDASRLPTA